MYLAATGRDSVLGRDHLTDGVRCNGIGATADGDASRKAAWRACAGVLLSRAAGTAELPLLGCTEVAEPAGLVAAGEATTFCCVGKLLRRDGVLAAAGTPTRTFVLTQAWCGGGVKDGNDMRCHLVCLVVVSVAALYQAPPIAPAPG